LIRLGFRHFAFVGIRTGWSRARQDGFEHRISAAGYCCAKSPTCRHVHDYHYMETRRAQQLLRRWVGKLPRPIAIMGCSDLVARTLLGACEEAGLRVPRDAAVLGVDNRVALCELAPVPISSMKQDFPRIGHEAARLLDRLISGAAAPKQAILVQPCGVAARRSTEMLAFEDEYVSAAMRLIHDRAPRGLSLKELLRNVPVSRKWLDVKFKSLVGDTPSREIRRVRLAQLRDLLLNTDLSNRQISRQCGFSNTENMIRFFRQAERLPPLQFRERQRARSSAFHF
jgi:LacI family transcriptional regulator